MCEPKLVFSRSGLARFLLSSFTRHQFNGFQLKSVTIACINTNASWGHCLRLQWIEIRTNFALVNNQIEILDATKLISHHSLQLISCNSCIQNNWFIWSVLKVTQYWVTCKQTQMWNAINCVFVSYYTAQSFHWNHINRFYIFSVSLPSNETISDQTKSVRIKAGISATGNYSPTLLRKHSTLCHVEHRMRSGTFLIMSCLLLFVFVSCCFLFISFLRFFCSSIRYLHHWITSVGFLLLSFSIRCAERLTPHSSLVYLMCATL